MDTKIRLLTKSLSWQASGIVVMTAIGYYFTQSFSAGGTIAIVGSLIGFFHTSCMNSSGQKFAGVDVQTTFKHPQMAVDWAKYLRLTCAAIP